jgi:ATP synthase protein I
MTENKTPRDEQAARFWRLAATMLGLVWNLVLPIVGGALLGYYLDSRLGHGVAWTVGLLLVGVTIAFYNLYHFLFEKTRN